jgi:hypothetical protein
MTFFNDLSHPTKQVTVWDIMSDLKSRGEYSIHFNEDTHTITSRHGKATLNTWALDFDTDFPYLICIGCRTIYNHSI